MKLVLLAAAVLAASMGGAYAKQLDLSGNNHKYEVTLADGRIEVAALPPVTLVKVVTFPSGEEGYHVVLGQCGGADVIFAEAQPMIILGKRSLVTLCGHELP